MVPRKIKIYSKETLILILMIGCINHELLGFFNDTHLPSLTQMTSPSSSVPFSIGRSHLSLLNASKDRLALRNVSPPDKLAPGDDAPHDLLALRNVASQDRLASSVDALHKEVDQREDAFIGRLAETDSASPLSSRLNGSINALQTVQTYSDDAYQYRLPTKVDKSDPRLSICWLDLAKDS